MTFDHFIPTKIIFGRGRLRELASIAAPMGRSVLIVCGRRSVQASGLLGRMRAALVSQHMAVHVFDGISPNPRSDEVDAAAAIARRQGCDMVIGVGGGSAIDAAKAAAVSIDYQSVREIIGETVPASARKLAVVAIPTTAGTGAEVTRGAIIKDVVRGFRSGVRGDGVFPSVALVDPDLSENMPGNVARATAFDALTHAIESYVARAATPITDVLAEQVFRLFSMHYGALADGKLDAAGHDDLCLAALIGGINIANTGSCLPHRLQQAMGSVDRIETSHPQGLAAVYPTWLRHVRPFAKARVDRVAHFLRFRPEDIAGEMAGLILRLGMNPTIGAYGYTRADLNTFQSGISGNLKNDPIDAIGPDLIRSIYTEAFHASEPVVAAAS
jgi:alcohol dehydrogenase class IV